MFAQFFAQIMLAEELCDLPASEHEHLLIQIRLAGNAAAQRAVDEDLQSRVGIILPRDKMVLPWRIKLKRLWRLEALRHPLWLCEDGGIYRAYIREGTGARSAWPSYWMRAELERREPEGLQRVLRALESFAAPPAEAPTHGNGVEI